MSQYLEELSYCSLSSWSFRHLSINITTC